jgi:plastocyanin
MRNSLKVFRNSVIFLCTLFLLNGCSSPDTNKSKNESAEQKTSTTSDTVVLQQMQFIPVVVNAKIGDTIVWINKDLVDHDITADSGKAFYSDTLHVGKIWKMAVTDSASYHCSIHPTMKGKIVIK